MKSEKITVVVPVYNVDQYLKRCVDSIREQSYKKLEIILVDDGSTDHSGEICDEYAKEDSRIIVIHKKNGGLSDARNTGLSAATGKYVAFIDSDDFILSNAIESMYNALRDSDSEIAACNMMKVYDDGTSERFYAPVRSKTVYEGDKRYLSLTQPSVCNKLFQISLFENIKFPVGKFYEDTFIYHELLFRAKKIVMTGEDSYWYFSRKGSILGQPIYTKRYFDFVQAVYQRAKFLLEHDVTQYGYEACLSLYSAMANVEKYVEITQETLPLLKSARCQYRYAYKALMKIDTGISLKQRVRLVLLRYIPKIHSKLY